MAGYVNVDREPREAPDVVCDLGQDRWPFLDNDVEHAVAEHVLEHLPGEAFFHFIRELYRVSKPGAQTRIVLPHPRHDIFLGDPTHCRPVMPGTMIMFSQRAVRALRERELFLTPFGEYHGVDFAFSDLQYTFDKDVDPDDPELEWKAKHLNNVIYEWSAVLTAVK